MSAGAYQPDLVGADGPISSAARDFGNVRALVEKLASLLDRKLVLADGAIASLAIQSVIDAPRHEAASGAWICQRNRA